MKMEKGMYVYCTTRFIGFHCWPDAPESVMYLRDLHRHEFHVKVIVKVNHNDRDVEFIGFKAVLEDFIDETKEKWSKSISCEQICQLIIDRFTYVQIHSVE